MPQDFFCVVIIRCQWTQSVDLFDIHIYSNCSLDALSNWGREYGVSPKVNGIFYVKEWYIA